MMDFVVLFIMAFIETAVCIFYYDSFMEYKGNKLHKLLSYIVIAMLLVGNALLFEIIPEQYYPLKLLPYIAMHMFFIKLCYRASWIMSIFFSGSAILLQILVQTLVIVLFQLKYSDDPFFINFMAVFACLISLCIEFFLRKRLPLLKEYLKKEYALLKSFIWLPLVTAIVGLFSYAFFVSPSGNMVFQGTVSAVLLVVNFISLFLLQDSLIKDEKIRLSEIQLESKQNQLQAFRDMQSLYERQGKKLHDYKKQLGTVEELLKAGDVDSAIGFTEQLTKSIAVEMSEVNIGHPVVNAVLNQYYRIAKSEDIGMSFTVGDMHDIRLSDDDIVVVMGNLLENAIHECEKIKSLGKTASVQVKLVEKDSKMIFTVRNPVVQKVEITDNKVQGAQQGGHGIGLSNVESVVEKYGGTFAISCDEKEFTAVAII